jgi:hypothetical protein
VGADRELVWAREATSLPAERAIEAACALLRGEPSTDPELANTAQVEAALRQTIGSKHLIWLAWEISIGLPQPTTQELARRFAELRQAACLDLETFVARVELDPRIVHELEAGTRSWTLTDIEAYADVLADPLSAFFATWDDPSRS